MVSQPYSVCGSQQHSITHTAARDLANHAGNALAASMSSSLLSTIRSIANPVGHAPRQKWKWVRHGWSTAAKPWSCFASQYRCQSAADSTYEPCIAFREAYKSEYSAPAPTIVQYLANAACSVACGRQTSLCPSKGLSGPAHMRAGCLSPLSSLIAADAGHQKPL